MKKDIVIFWGELAADSTDPIRFDKKKETYRLFFEKLINLDCRVFVTRGLNNYLGNNIYRVNWEYKDGAFSMIDEVIQPYSVYDRSGGVHHPNKFLNNAVNDIDFKLFARNKWQSYIEFREYFPTTFILDTPENLKKFLSNYNESQKFVAKPVEGMKGKDIHFLTIKDYDFIVNTLMEDSKRYLLQEFIDTTKGIKGIAHGVHDLRVVSLNGEIIWSHVRQPGNGTELKANVAEGGSIDEISDFSTLPTELVKITKDLIQIFYSKYNNPLFTVDFGVTADGPKIFEFNSQCGFPLPLMKNMENFNTHLARRLTNI
jgi:hypothetical protein